MEYRSFRTRSFVKSFKFISVLCAVSCLTGNAKCSFPSVDGCTLHRDHEDLLHASCRGQSLTSIPTSLPAEITKLDLSYNRLDTVPDHIFARYTRLRVLDLHHNSIVSISPCAFEGLAELHVLNLASNNLSSLEANHRIGQNPHRNRGGCSAAEFGQNVPTTSHRIEKRGIFLPLSRLRTLDLSYNMLGTVSADTFAGLGGSLQKLDLTANVLRDVGNGSFLGLDRLTSLNISKNELTFLSPAAFRGLSGLKELRLMDNDDFDYDNDTFPPDVFRPFASSLTLLSLSGSEAFGTTPLPDSALATLVSLQHLIVDKLIHPEFVQGFATMKSLTTLDFADSCNVETVRNESLSGLRSITTLRLQYCSSLLVLDACAFCPLQRLQVLSLHGASSLGVKHALRSVSAFVGRNISVLNFRDVGRNNRRGIPGTVMDEKITEFLVQTCVSTLILSRNDITAIRLHAFTKAGSLFSQCIQRIDLSKNYIFTVSPLEVVLVLATFKNLRSLQLDEQRTCSLRRAMEHDRVGYSPVSKRGKSWKWALGYNFRVPPLLNYLNLSGMSCSNTGHIPKTVTVRKPNSIKVIDVSYIYLTICETVFKGFERLESLNVSRSYCSAFKPTVFDSFPMLRELSLQRISFDHRQFRKGAGKLFRNMPFLRRFDFSFNSLDVPLTELLHAQRDLRELLLAENRYDRLPLELGQHANLSVLDLSRNAISLLPEEDREALDRFAASRGGLFSLRLRGNPIACTCQALPFIRWLGETRVRLDNEFDYTCVSEDGSVRSTAEVLRNLHFEWRKCVGATMLWGAVVGMLLLLAFLGGAWAMAANASRLRFFVTVFRRMKMPRREHFRKDAYVSYCDDDTEFVVLHLKRVLQDQRGVDLLIKDMPIDEAATQFYLVPGEDLAEKMLEHIDMCWKVLLVLTPALGRDVMAGLMTRAALQSISDKMAERVVLLCVGVRHMPALASLRALLQTVPERQVVFVPHGAGDAHPAWDTVADVILN